MKANKVEENRLISNQSLIIPKADVVKLLEKYIKDATGEDVVLGNDDIIIQTGSEKVFPFASVSGIKTFWKKVYSRPDPSKIKSGFFTS